MMLNMDLGRTVHVKCSLLQGQWVSDIVLDTGSTRTLVHRNFVSRGVAGR